MVSIELKASVRYSDAKRRLDEVLERLLIETGTGSKIDGLELPPEKWEQVDHIRGAYWLKLSDHAQVYKLNQGHEAFPDDAHEFTETFIHLWGDGVWTVDGEQHQVGGTGSVLVIAAGTRHGYRAITDSCMVAVQDGVGFLKVLAPSS